MASPNRAELAQGEQVPAAQRPGEDDAVITEAEVDLDRAVHTAAAVGLHLAGQFGQGDSLGDSAVEVTVVEQVEVLELLG